MLAVNGASLPVDVDHLPFTLDLVLLGTRGDKLPHSAPCCLCTALTFCYPSLIKC